MRKIILLSIIGLTLFGSCSRKNYPASVQDSTRIDTRVEYIEKIRDTTVYVEVPREVETYVTRDTSSHLENSVAISNAVISGGLLFHSLESKNIALPATVHVKEVEVTRDSIVYRDKEVVNTVEVERKLTRWQKLRMDLGGWLMGAVLLIIGYFAVKIFVFKKV